MTSMLSVPDRLHHHIQSLSLDSEEILYVPVTFIIIFTERNIYHAMENNNHKAEQYIITG